MKYMLLVAVALMAGASVASAQGLPSLGVADAKKVPAPASVAGKPASAQPAATTYVCMSPCINPYGREVKFYNGQGVGATKEEAQVNLKLDCDKTGGFLATSYVADKYGNITNVIWDITKACN